MKPPIRRDFFHRWSTKIDEDNRRLSAIKKLHPGKEKIQPEGQRDFLANPLDKFARARAQTLGRSLHARMYNAGPAGGILMPRICATVRIEFQLYAWFTCHSPAGSPQIASATFGATPSSWPIVADSWCSLSFSCSRLSRARRFNGARSLSRVSLDEYSFVRLPFLSLFIHVYSRRREGEWERQTSTVKELIITMSRGYFGCNGRTRGSITAIYRRWPHIDSIE